MVEDHSGHIDGLAAGRDDPRVDRGLGSSPAVHEQALSTLQALTLSTTAMNRFRVELVLIMAGGDDQSLAKEVKAKLLALKRKYKGGIVFWHDVASSSDRAHAMAWAKANKVPVVPFKNASLMLRLATERFKSGEKAGLLMFPTRNVDAIRATAKNCGLPLWEIQR